MYLFASLRYVVQAVVHSTLRYETRLVLSAVSAPAGTAHEHRLRIGFIRELYTDLPVRELVPSASVHRTSFRTRLGADSASANSGRYAVSRRQCNGRAEGVVPPSWQPPLLREYAAVRVRRASIQARPQCAARKICAVGMLVGSLLPSTRCTTPTSATDGVRECPDSRFLPEKSEGQH